MHLKSLLLAALGMVLSGCLVIPTGFPDREPFRTADTEFLTAGTTTKQDVLRAFEKPEQRGDGWWLYRVVRKGAKWYGCFGYGYVGHCESLDRSRTNYFLVVDFQGDTVSSYEVLDDDQLCERRRICYAGDMFSTGYLAAADARLSVDPGSGPDCAIYLFTNSKGEEAMSRIYVDEAYVGNLTTDKNYYQVSAPPGELNVTVFRKEEADWLKRLNVTTVRTPCATGQSVFAEYVTKGANTSLIIIGEQEGLESIGRRWRADTTIDELHERVTWIGDRFFVVAVEGRISIFQPDSGGIVWSEANLDASETCGYRTALADYDLTLPSIHVAHTPALHYKRGFVEVKVVCNENDECELPSFFDGETCEATPGKQVEFNGDSYGLFSDHLLVLEPADDGAVTVFFGPKRPLKKHADCDGKRCVIGLDSLRTSDVKQFEIARRDGGDTADR